MFLFFANTRVMMEIFFPTFTTLLSSPTVTQFSQSTLFFLRMESILLKNAPISNSCTETFPLLSTNKRIKTGFNFPMPDFWPISTKWVKSTIRLTDEFRSKDNINFYNDYEAIICENFTLCIHFKCRNSANGKKNSWMRENELFR